MCKLDQRLCDYDDEFTCCPHGNNTHIRYVRLDAPHLRLLLELLENVVGINHILDVLAVNEKFLYASGASSILMTTVFRTSAKWT